MRHPKVSVLVPTYNRIKYLQEALDSIFRQSFTDFEVVVVDNCSTDETAAVMAACQDARLRYIRNEVNVGAVGNYNKALQAAKGEYICLFSDDDVMTDVDNLRLKVEILDTHASVGVVHSDIIIIDANGAVIGDNWARNNKSWPQVIAKPLLSGAETHRILYEDWNFVNMPAVLLRRSLLVKYGLEFNNQLRYLIDWNLWLQLSLFSDFYYVNKQLVSYRRHTNNESSLMNPAVFFNELVLSKIGLLTLFPTNEVVRELTVQEIVAHTAKQLGRKQSIRARLGTIKKMLYQTVKK